MATPRILMCPPKYFAVEYVINPWMEGQIGNASNSTAVAQWTELHKVVSSLTGVELIEPGEHLPDMCFAANGGLVVGKRFVKPRFRVAQRKPGGRPIRGMVSSKQLRNHYLVGRRAVRRRR